MIRYLNPNRYLNPSRYSKLRLIQGSDSDKPYHEVLNMTPDVRTNECKLLTVTGDLVDRLDLVAYKEYQDPSLWWFLAKQNHLENPTNLPIGTVLQIPPYNSLLEDGRALEPMSYLFLNLGVDE